jgi:hypothetical protein
MTKFWSTTGSNCGTVTPCGLLRTPESQDQLPSPLGYGVIFKMNSYNSSSFMELSSNFNTNIALLCKTELKKQNIYIHDLPTLTYLKERGTLGIGRFPMEPFEHPIDL